MTEPNLMDVRNTKAKHNILMIGIFVLGILFGLSWTWTYAHSEWWAAVATVSFVLAGIFYQNIREV